MEIRVAAEKRLGSFSLSVDFSTEGERIGIFGRSGSGKSTLVALLAGLEQPDSGEIVIGGEYVFSSRKRINVPPDLRRIAMVFQNHALFPHLSVRSNLMYGYRRCSGKNRTVDFDALVEVLDLSGILDRGVAYLSGGEKQRVALGRAVLSSPRLLVMDEPLSALDDGLRFRIIPYLRSASSDFGIPYLFISHSLLEMRLMTDHAVVLRDGAVAEQTSPEQLARSRMGESPVGYINLLKLHSPRVVEGLYAYRWGSGELVVSAGCEREETMFELSSKDIILFRRHPESISARNLIRGKVVSMFDSGNRVGVELETDGGRVVAEVVGAAVREMGIAPGDELYAAVKAAAFRRIG